MWHGAALVSALMACRGMPQFSPSPSVEPGRLWEHPREGLVHAPCWCRESGRCFIFSSFCECPLWREVWRSAVLGGTSVAVQRKVVNSHILYSVNTACMLIQIIVYGADNNELIGLHFICTYHFTDLGCEVQINTQQCPYRDKRILFSYIQLLLHCIVDTEI